MDTFLSCVVEHLPDQLEIAALKIQVAVLL